MYFITCIQNSGKEIKNNEPHYGDIRTFGYEETYADAEADLNMNVYDMHEFLYSYAVIENIPEGKINKEGNEEKNRTWFLYDKEKDGFFKTEKPNQNNIKGWFSLF